MKKLLVIVTVLLIAAAAPVLACGEKSADAVQRNVKNLDNGVQIMLASTDGAMVKQIQEKGADCKGCCKGGCPMMSEKVTRVVEQTDNGLTITATSNDPETITLLQAHAAEMGGGCKFKKGMKGEKASGDCPHKGKVDGQVAAAR